ncbi:class I SAM-dependent methyltransferase [Mesorhizobium sp. VK9D]|uniref:class I SAM-dependent DNA methyltransferase n=1 Tax=Mesorhizobium australafricanum TaxID=3072311 RepID=UPI002A24112D|nr:class I SAM-dependent methyltransferase [Mesorhizobium sp. VK9D]MDX8455301.1 class I SAM-dependent methyltransferase [Mesorhizobium sp. VK9D]
MPLGAAVETSFRWISKVTNFFSYGETWAPFYDKFSRVRGKCAEAPATAAFLERYSGGGTALELGIGDGRVAVPLNEFGIRVEGIDNSTSMLEMLAKRTSAIKAWRGDIGNFKSNKRYALIYCVFNTLTLLFTRERQLGCLRSAADAMDENGMLVLELGVPVFDGFVDGEKTTTVFVDDENTILNASVHDSVNQTLVSSLLWFSETSVRRLPYQVRYLYHQELDTMAESVGLQLAERWGDWAKGAFTGSSKRHISVYRRVGA